MESVYINSIQRSLVGDWNFILRLVCAIKNRNWPCATMKLSKKASTLSEMSAA